MTSCYACKLQPHGWMYSCKTCSFTLHISCTQMANLITHPSHLIHPLTLFAAPPYPGGSFKCDGCGLQGTGFSYRCTTCDFDVHMICATNPMSLAHQSHPHQLNLVFYPPYQTKGFSCHICDHKIGSNHWLYRCGSCEFDAHMECAKSANNRPSPHLQHSNSSPAPNNVNLHQYLQQQKKQRRQQQKEQKKQQRQQQKEQRQQQKEQRQQQKEQRQQQKQQKEQQQPSERPNGADNIGTLKRKMLQGFVEGVARQVGETVWRCVCGCACD
ncbi:CYSTEINE/HISTIDINE-RICH C1 DOMAIN FAMILY PROTEIN [Salix koriyanagi]|uniref:CYSTEINE/HISTIDINE-RICH C1 DOMAIN FAMILY PROTEIN n=1 Tax=Salix koriyanagi TaxID=2511006 RepID=A0A9Q0NIA3_9ROSI|nr:CYSTEINE/HISTIDINE-RICH C1 DOMAIN FAMILY PROTEIN [Salix koriyanagi]